MFPSLLTLALLAQSIAAPAQPDNPQATAKVKGQVRHALTREPLKGALVTVMGGNGQQQLAVESRDDGSFEITGISPGYGSFMVSRRGFTQKFEFGQNTGFNLKPGETVERTLLMLPEAIVTGRVLDPQGQPISNATVEAYRGVAAFRSAVTDERGEFRLTRIPEGKYRFRAKPSLTGYMGLPPEIRTDGSVEPNFAAVYYPGSISPANASWVPLKAGQTLTGIDIVLQPSPILFIEGQVDPPSKSNDIHLQLISEAGYPQSFPVSSEGKFYLGRLSPGKYYLAANRYANNGPPTGSLPTMVDLTAAPATNLVLPLYPPIDAKIVVAYEGTPPAKESQPQTVFLAPSDQNLRFISRGGGGRREEDGTYLLRSVQRGLYAIQLNNPNGSTYYLKSVRVGSVEHPDRLLDLTKDPAAEPIVLTLAPGAAELSGNIPNIGDRAGRYAVALLGPVGDGPRRFRQSTIDATGNWSINGLTPGPYQIVLVESSDLSDLSNSQSLLYYTPAAESLELKPNDKRTFQLRLP